MVMAKILVTGGAGFVGRHLIARLLADKHEVHCVDPIVPLTGGIDPEQGWPLFDPRDHAGFHFYKEDCRSWFLTHKDTDFDYAYHLAAMVGGRMMIEHNPLVVAEDLAIDAMFWLWAKAVRPGRSVCFSSSAAYPVSLQRPQGYTLLKEDMISFGGDIGMPDMTYGWAKLTNEYLARLAHEHHGLKTISYRPFSGYGSDQDMAYPFPSICQRILDNEGASTIQVWGSGKQMRDFIHIDDCVTGILKTVDQIDDGAAVNLSTGILTSFACLASMAAQEVGYHPDIRGMSDKPEGVFARGGDTSKQHALGFKAGISLVDGVAEALRYLSARSAVCA
jgi:nucleoside-diphosphate-sugar epimerase